MTVLVLPATIEVGFGPSEEPLQVRVDPRGLEQALWNLAINARHAMADGGTLQLRTGVDDGYAFVSVADSGPGIPEDIQRRIFDPYFTTKPRGQGTGLGLAAVDRFVRGSRGRVRLESVLFLYDRETGASRPLFDGMSHDQQEAWAIFGPYPNYAWMPDGGEIVFWAQGKIWRIDVGTRAVREIPFEAEVERRWRRLKAKSEHPDL